jgi:hypothetical protein
MRRFFTRLASYRRLLLGLLVGSILPFLKDQFASRVFDAAWDRIGGPAVLEEVGRVMAAYPLHSAAAAVMVWLAIAAFLSERHVRRLARSGVVSRQLGTILLERGQGSASAAISPPTLRERCELEWGPKSEVFARVAHDGRSIDVSRFKLDDADSRLVVHFELVEYDRDIVSGSTRD